MLLFEISLSLLILSSSHLIAFLMVLRMNLKNLRHFMCYLQKFPVNFSVLAYKHMHIC